MKHAILDTIPNWRHQDACDLIDQFDYSECYAPGCEGRHDHGGIVACLLLLPFAGEAAAAHPVRLYGVLNGDGHMLDTNWFMWAMDHIENWIGPDEDGTLNMSWGRADEDLDVTNPERWEKVKDGFYVIHRRILAFQAARPRVRIFSASGNSNGIPTLDDGLIYDQDPDVDLPAYFAPAPGPANPTPRWFVVGAHATGDHWPLRTYSGDGPQVTLIAGDGERALGPGGWHEFFGTSGACPEANAVYSHALETLGDPDRAAAWMLRSANHPIFLAADNLTEWHDPESGAVIRHCWHHGAGTVHPHYMAIRARGMAHMRGSSGDIRRFDPSIIRPSEASAPVVLRLGLRSRD